MKPLRGGCVTLGKNLGKVRQDTFRRHVKWISPAPHRHYALKHTVCPRVTAAIMPAFAALPVAGATTDALPVALTRSLYLQQVSVRLQCVCVCVCHLSAPHSHPMPLR